jgi:periplasmic copper chaperone A
MFRTLATAAAATLLPLTALACEGLTVSEPAARASGTMAQAGALYMTLENAGSTDCRLVAARSDISDRLELHTHVEDEQGVMRMVEIEEGIVIPAGGEHRLERGGDHIMFMGLNRTIEHGERIDVTLVFEDDSEIAVSVPLDMERMGVHGVDEESAEDSSHGHGD